MYAGWCVAMLRRAQIDRLNFGSTEIQFFYEGVEPSFHQNWLWPPALTLHTKKKTSFFKSFPRCKHALSFSFEVHSLCFRLVRVFKTIVALAEFF